MRITIVTIGTRGDVQPYVALGVGLQAAGHRVRINTHALFEDFVRERGLDFAPLAGDPRDGMEAYTTELIGASTVRFFQLFGVWLRSIVEQVLDDIWNACQDADALLFSPLGLPAYHVAQKRGVPVCGAFYLPMWHPTRRFASLSAPALPSPVGVYNLLTHYIGRLTILQSFRQPLNDWLQEQLGLERLPLLRWPYDHLNGRPIPALYGYSPTVLPRPPEWNEHVYVTGYWFLDTPREWQPPRDLLDFLGSGPPPVYVGFGSLIEKDPGAVIELVVRALAQAGQRGILLANQAVLSQSDLPDHVFAVESIPHDWLFPRMAAVVHHGGAGTTAAGLRAGAPSIIVPYFLDQPFWGKRVQALGAGTVIPRKGLTAEKLAEAIRTAVTDERLRRGAAAIGQRIRAENGVARAVEIFLRYAA